MRLNNARHENFIQHVSAGTPAGRAYEAAGFSARGAAADANASRLLRNDKVAARLDELQEDTGKKLDITRERIVEMFLEDRRRADQLEQPKEMHAVTEKIALFCGFSFDAKVEEPPQPIHGDNVVSPPFGAWRKNYGAK